MKEPANVLVVDDNSDLLNTFSLILKRKGYRVDTADDGDTAVNKFQSSRFDVTLMDLVMPRMDGVEAFRKIREINPRAKVILMTAYYDEGQIKDVLSEGAYSAVHKPINIAKLLDLIGDAAVNPPILIVDDDEDFRCTLAKVLELKGFRVAVAGSGEEALRIARQRSFPLAFIDVKLPIMDGLETYLRLKEINSEVVSVMMTGYREEVGSLVQAALEASAARCLYKPFDVSEVVELVGKVVEKTTT